MKIAIPLRRVIDKDFIEALKALARAKGLDVKHVHAIARAIRQAKDAVADHAETTDALRAKHDGVFAPGGFVTFDRGNDREAAQKAMLDFQADMKAALEASVEFTTNGLIKLPEGLTADHAAELIEFFEAEQEPK